MIQDIGPHTYHNEYRPVFLTDRGILLSYDGRSVLVKTEGGHLIFPRLSDFPDQAGKAFRWLFREDEEQYFWAEQPLPEGHGFSYVPINFLRAAEPRFQAFAGVAGLSLAGWYMNHRFCGQCGRPMEHSRTERMVYCDHCHTMMYPRICPAVIVAVRNGSRLLISKYAGREYKRAALIAGFAEIGEMIEDTVHREVMEEVGVKVKNLQFYKSQPWCFTDTLLFGFFCDLDGDDTLHVDHDELAVARWVEREELPDDPEKASLTMEMMTLFKTGIL
ncbi:NADH pyrophosphatase [Megasphaera cerevisiae DSM 20462]|jgi:NAD+ diphosphatase|uniref:NAD(+) diphosphatase n=1 Tax=Megasphaera cerevisiae DSM 20462 TaxID=1122219 RepID=A0A0J6ZQ23_9FIRM|nr:NAD(+) diphosphatase [Megasphaera cerevisiae]KMO87016.1 NADH pyrophosphatase [Megasphaera cerevisiae DSM 20462]MCI1750554.1 NAD(+) diphosphatase [Megasphaera cerevisiae]SJZ81920.1 NAD+ diphosphatase [Megasphaera cerevisiae DSM 20462]